MLTIKEKHDIFEYIRIKFCPSKDTIKRVKREVRVGEEFATNITNKDSSPECVKFLQMRMQDSDKPLEKLDQGIEYAEM